MRIDNIRPGLLAATSLMAAAVLYADGTNVDLGGKSDSSGTQAAAFWRTGFEAEHEAFGQTDIGFSRGGGLRSDCVHGGKRSMTPGPGGGKYGKSAPIIFAKPIVADDIWIAFWYRSADDQPQGYKAFVYVSGESADDKNNSVLLARLMITADKISAATDRVLPFKSGGEWRRVKLHLKFKTGQYDLEVDDRKLDAIPLGAGACGGETNGLTKIIFGGGASKTKLTYYDDIYVGSAEPPLNPENPPMFPPWPGGNDAPFMAVNPAQSPPVIDGQLEDECWRQASVLTPFLGAGGEYGKYQQTQVLCAYDATNFYIGFKCFDIYLDPVLNQLHMVSTKATERDSGVFKDDSVEIFIAPFGDRPESYYHIAINCAGTIYDAALPAPGPSWNGAIAVGVHKTDAYWNLEICIPLKELKVAALKAGDTWKVNFCRNKRTLGELTVWSPTFGSFHDYRRFGTLRFGEHVPVIKAMEWPDVLAEGSNAITLQIGSDREARLVLQNKLGYENADEVISAAPAAVPAGKTINTTNVVVVYTDAPSRRSARSCAAALRLADAGSGEIFYASPKFVYPILKYTPFRSSFIAHLSGVYSVAHANIYIANNSSLFRNLLIQASGDIAGKFKQCEFVIDMPKGLELQPPEGSWRDGSTNFAFTREAVLRNGKQRVRYTVAIPADWTYSMEKVSPKNRYIRSINLLFLCQADGPLPRAETITLQARAEIGGKCVEEPIVEMPLTILPAIQGRPPKTYPIISSFSGYNSTCVRLKGEQRRLCLRNIVQAGFNVFSVTENPIYTVEFVAEVRAQGLKIEKGFFENPFQKVYPYLFPDATDYLQRYPQYRAVTSDGKPLAHVVSLTHLLNGAGEYHRLAERRVGEIARTCDMLLDDHEVPVAPADGSRALSFSEQDLDEFRKFAGLDGKVAIADIQARYAGKWLEFQCRQNARRAALISRWIKRANSNCLFGVYSGYQHDPPHYGTDWRLMAGAIDYAQCGYGRPLAQLEATIKAIAPKKLIASELVNLHAGDIGYNFDNLRLTLFRRITDGNGGLMLFYGTIVDGRFWTAVGDISRLVSDYEPFFLNQVKARDLVAIQSGFQEGDLAVFRNTAGERLIFLFNNTAKAAVYRFGNLARIPGARLRDYYEGRDLGDPEDVNVEVAPLDVKVLVYIRGKVVK